jgi:dinuclear metal center protein, ybgI family
MILAEVMEYIKVKLNRPVLPYGGKEKEIVESIALCGGAATCFMNDAVRAGADLYLTGDVKYHDFQQAVKDDIFLVDGGHYGTEFPVVFELQRLLQTESEKRGWEVKFVVDSTSRDFISYL